MSILWTIIIGLIVGALAKFVMPGKDPGGIIITILLGIVGAFVGTFIGRALGLYSQGQAAGWIMSVIGAIIVLAIYRAVAGRRPVVDAGCRRCPVRVPVRPSDRTVGHD